MPPRGRCQYRLLLNNDAPPNLSNECLGTELRGLDWTPESFISDDTDGRDWIYQHRKNPTNVLLVSLLLLFSSFSFLVAFFLHTITFLRPKSKNFYNLPRSNPKQKKLKPLPTFHLTKNNSH